MYFLQTENAPDVCHHKIDDEHSGVLFYYAIDNGFLNTVFIAQ